MSVISVNEAEMNFDVTEESDSEYQIKKHLGNNSPKKTPSMEKFEPQ